MTTILAFAAGAFACANAFTLWAIARPRSFMTFFCPKAFPRSGGILYRKGLPPVRLIP